MRAPLEALRRRAGWAPLPWGLDLLLTDACNLRCSYCPMGAGVDPGRPRRFVETAKAIAFLDSIAWFRPMVRLFGGEPLLHPEWRRILEAAVARGLPVTLVTNGTLLRGLADDLVRSGILAVGISIDPPNANDRHRGEGVFAACADAVAALAAARERHGTPTPAIEIYTTVHGESYSDLAAWAERLAGWGVDTLRLQHLMWLSPARRAASEALIRSAIGDASFFRAEVEEFCTEAMPPIDGAVLAAQLDALQSRGHPFRLEIEPPLPVDETVAFYLDPEFRRRTARACTLISTYAFVDPAGRLYPCLTLDMGDVFARPFAEVWNGAKFRAYRRLLLREGRLPLCDRCPS
ncbi:MAG TPA: radical SAM protein [Thermoanaerobaculia bacterium]